MHSNVLCSRDRGGVAPPNTGRGGVGVPIPHTHAYTILRIYILYLIYTLYPTHIYILCLIRILYFTHIYILYTHIYRYYLLYIGTNYLLYCVVQCV